MAKNSVKKQDNGNGGTDAKQRRFGTYPSINLKEAVERVGLLYKADKTAGAPINTAVLHMGYTSKSGPAMAAIASLKKFGLLKSENKRLVPTQRAIEIAILSDDDDRKAKALKDAAVAPPLFAELAERFRKTGVPSSASLESDLILDGKVNANSAAEVVKDFKDTLIYSGLADENGIISSEYFETDADADIHTDPLGMDIFDRFQKKPDQPKPDGGKMISLPVTLPTLKIVTVTVPDRMTELEFKTLIDTITGWKSALVKTTESVQAETAKEPQPDTDEDSE